MKASPGCSSAKARALLVDLDIAKAQQLAVVQPCVDVFGTPDIVVSNAGSTHRNQPTVNVDEATFDRVFKVNVKTIYYMTHAVLQLMRKRGSGNIINISSTASAFVAGVELPVDGGRSI